MNIEVVRPLKIGFIGYNREQTDTGLEQFVKSNKDQVTHFARCEVVLEDGTKIVPIYNEDNVRGKKFDQIILCDDERWNIWEKRKDLIEYVFWYMAGHSCIPEEYIVMKCEY
jgi:hypothetical protein